jgi:hypothetical protein
VIIGFVTSSYIEYWNTFRRPVTDSDPSRPTSPAGVDGHESTDLSRPNPPVLVGADVPAGAGRPGTESTDPSRASRPNSPVLVGANAPSAAPTPRSSLPNSP